MRIPPTAACLAVFLAAVFTVGAESRQEIESSNSYGGSTVEVVYAEGDANFGLLDASRLFFDGGGSLVRSLSRLSPTKTQETGITYQEESYTLGVRSGYKMFFSEAQRQIRGYDFVAERVDAQDHVISTTYGWGGKEVTDSNTSFMKNYPFFTLSYTKGRLLEGPPPNATGDTVVYSAKFNHGRAFVKFSGEIQPMTETDNRIAGYYFGARGIQGGLEHYHKKALVIEEGLSFTIYLQDGLLPYVIPGNDALISYLDVGFNGEMYLLLTGLIDIH